MRRFLVPFVLAVAAVVVGFFLGTAWKPEKEEPPPAEVVERHSPNVIVAVRGLARLEGAEYHIERVVDLKERQSRLHGLIEAEDAILLVAVGKVVAGVDLSELIEADVVVDESGKRVRLRLPPAQVFSARLDSSRTYVHTRKTDALAVRQEDLETKARARAEATLEQAAVEGGILRRSEINVQRTVTLLLHSLGFEHVEVTFRSPRTETEP